MKGNAESCFEKVLSDLQLRCLKFPWMDLFTYENVFVWITDSRDGGWIIVGFIHVIPCKYGMYLQNNEGMR